MEKITLSERIMHLGIVEGYTVHTEINGNIKDEYVNEQKLLEMIRRGTVIDGVGLDENKDKILLESRVYKSLRAVVGEKHRVIGKITGEDGKIAGYRVMNISDGEEKNIKAKELWQMAADGCIDGAEAKAVKHRNGKYARLIIFNS